MNFKMKIAKGKLKTEEGEILRPRALRLAPDGFNAMRFAIFFIKGDRNGYSATS
jgi:hypothetical protein